VESGLLGQIDKLKYSNHDVADADKFLKFAKRVYLETVGINPVGEPISQPLRWETGSKKTGILGLLYLPHFGRGHYASTCVKQLLAFTHGGDICLDKLISIDVEIIVNIRGFPSWGMDHV
jgi:hypothetical protein